MGHINADGARDSHYYTFVASWQRDEFKGEAILGDKKVDYEMKKKVCKVLGEVYDGTVKAVIKILKGTVSQLSNYTDVSEMLTDYLCNQDDPGLRDMISYQKFDFSKKCIQADEAECEYALATAVSEGKILYRKEAYKEGRIEKIEYRRGLESDMKRQIDDGNDVIFDCTSRLDLESSLFWREFDAKEMAILCGRAGFPDYIEK